MTLTDILKNDPDWQKAKTNASKIKSEKVLTKLQYLKYVGAKNFTEAGYKEYIKLSKKE